MRACLQGEHEAVIEYGMNCGICGVPQSYHHASAHRFASFVTINGAHICKHCRCLFAPKTDV
jgi:hypothetical protein